MWREHGKGPVRQLLPQQACRDGGVFPRRKYATNFNFTSGCKHKVFTASTPLVVKTCAASVLMATVVCKNCRVQVFLPQKKEHRKKRTQMLLVIVLVVGYAHLSRPSTEAGSVFFVNPEEARCKWIRKGVPSFLGGCIGGRHFSPPNRPSPARVYTKNLPLFHPAGRSYEGHGHQLVVATGGSNTIFGTNSIPSFWRKRAGCGSRRPARFPCTS